MLELICISAIIGGMKTKSCTKCKIEKPTTEFGRDKRIRSGLCSRCKLCVAEYNRARYLEQREQVIERVANYARNNKEEIRARCKAYYQRNKDRIKEKTKRWREANLNRAKKTRNLRVRHNAAELTDSYVRQIMIYQSPIKAKDIPDELVELKRAQLLLHRQLKETKK
jgi:ElaB/YqjD/DUF883 family membrane-anchored ribosome-binding protein